MPDRGAVQVAAEHEPRLPGAPLARADDRLALGEPPRDAQHQREREVRGRLGEHAGRVADRNPAGGGRLHVDVVHADRVVRDRPQARRGLDQLGVHRIGEQREQALQLAARGASSSGAAAAGARARRPPRARPRGASSASPGSSRVTKTLAWAPIGSRSMARAEASGKTQSSLPTQRQRWRWWRTTSLGPRSRPLGADCIQLYSAPRSGASTSGRSRGRSSSGVDRRGGGGWRRQHRPGGGRGRSCGDPGRRGPGRHRERLRRRGGAARRSAGRLRAGRPRHRAPRAVELGWLNPRAPIRERGGRGLPAPAAERAGGPGSGCSGPLAYADGAPCRRGSPPSRYTCLVDCDGRELLAGEAWQVTVAVSGAFGAGVDARGRRPDRREAWTSWGSRGVSAWA